MQNSFSKSFSLFFLSLFLLHSFFPICQAQQVSSPVKKNWLLEKPQGFYNVTTFNIDPVYGPVLNGMQTICGYKFNPHIDRVEIGIKAVSDHLNINYTGVSNKPVLENLEKLVADGKDTFVESVFIPGLIDLDEIERIAQYVASVKKDMLFVILPYFRSGDNPWRRPTIVEMEKAHDVARKHLSRVFFFRGDEELKYKVMSAFPEGIGEIKGSVSPAFLASQQPDLV